MSDPREEYPLIGKTKSDRLERQALLWPGTPMEKKRQIMDRMAQLAASPATGPREAVSAAKVLLQADKLNFEVEKNLPPVRVGQVHIHNCINDNQLTTHDIHCLMEHCSAEQMQRILELGYWPEDIERPQ